MEKILSKNTVIPINGSNYVFCTENQIESQRIWTHCGSGGKVPLFLRVPRVTTEKYNVYINFNVYLYFDTTIFLI